MNILLVRANDTMQVDTSVLTEMEVLKRIGFHKTHQAAGSGELFPSLISDTDIVWTLE